MIGFLQFIFPAMQTAAVAILCIEALGALMGGDRELIEMSAGPGLVLFGVGTGGLRLIG